MRIKWTQDVELEVMEDKDNSYSESVKIGELDDVRIIAENGESVDMEFACGDVSYSVSKTCFEEIPE